MDKTILEKIYLSSLKLLIPLDLEETFQTVTSEACKLVKSDYGSLFLEEHSFFNRVYSTSPMRTKVNPRARGFAYQAIKQKKILIKSKEEIWRVHPEWKGIGVKTNIFIPLAYKLRSIGVLVLNSRREYQLSPQELQALKLFGSMASLAIRKTQLHYETKRALAIRDLFISMAAHELKTPVTTIYGYAQLLLNNQRNRKEIKTDWVNSLHSESARLKFLINDLLEMSRINTRDLHYSLKECSLQKIFGRVLDNFKFSYPDRSVVFENKIATGQDKVIGDHDKLIQAFINVLDNAAKFSAPNSEIRVTLRPNGSNFVIRVKDSGKGISEKDLPRIFESYYKGEGTSHEGLGLGLFLVKNIIEKHHGSVSIKSKINKGTTIEIKLPKVKKV